MSFPPKVTSVSPMDNMMLSVTFENGIKKIYDVKQLASRFSVFKELENPDVFNLVHVDCGGYAIAWNDEIDLAENELWTHGKEVRQ